MGDDGGRPGGAPPSPPRPPDPRPPKSERIQRIQSLAESPLILDAPPLEPWQIDRLAGLFGNRPTVSGRNVAVRRPVGLAALRARAITNRPVLPPGTRPGSDHPSMNGHKGR